MVDTIHRNIRKTIFLYYRIRNRLSAYYNRIVLFIMGVKYGKNCMIQGKFYIKLFPTAKLIIGDNLHYSSGFQRVADWLVSHIFSVIPPFPIHTLAS